MKFPIIKENPFPRRVLSMDEYVAFVEFNLKKTLNKASSNAQKKELRVLVPFVLRPVANPSARAAEPQQPIPES